MKYDYLHESKEVFLIPSSPQPCSKLAEALLPLGYTEDDGFYYLKRTGEHPNWQSENIVSVDVYKDGQEIEAIEDEFDDEPCEWDKLKFEYLLATLPVYTIDLFVDGVTQVSEKLKYPLIYEGRKVSSQELKKEFRKCANELRRNVGEPGSKSVRIEIALTYPRKKKDM
ncbi:hypothetical protein [Desmospora profundinema]|uniref:Uncharacterized protein n=1 Tax=Desmospora profundinema TaxID=1571184 RepID=A0ABU1IQW2_9BACL|nr:hypothetical protein [Desmospora profundinema]MDR6227191.1 hypothetical protein [Desmospora profundinema]